VLGGRAILGGTSSVGMDTTTDKRESFLYNVEQTAVDIILAFREGMDWCTVCSPTEPTVRPFHQGYYRSIPGQHHAHFLNPQKNVKNVDSTAASCLQQQQEPPPQEPAQFKRSVARVLESQNEWVSFDLNTSGYSVGDRPPSWMADIDSKTAVETSAHVELKDIKPSPNSQIHSASGRAKARFIQQSYSSATNNSKDKLHRRQASGFSVVRLGNESPAVETIPSPAAWNYWSIGELPKQFFISRASEMHEHDSLMKKPDPPSEAMIVHEGKDDADTLAPTEPPLSSYLARSSFIESPHYGVPENGGATPRHGVEETEPLRPPSSILPIRWNRDASIAPHLLRDVSSSNVMVRSPSDPPIVSAVDADEEDSRRIMHRSDKCGGIKSHNENRMQPQHDTSSGKEPDQNDEHMLISEKSYSVEPVAQQNTKDSDLVDIHRLPSEIRMRLSLYCSSTLDLDKFSSRRLDDLINDGDTSFDGSLAQKTKRIGLDASPLRPDAPCTIH